MDTVGGDFSHRDTGRGTAVEFVCTPTAADFEEALRAGQPCGPPSPSWTVSRVIS